MRILVGEGRLLGEQLLRLLRGRGLRAEHLLGHLPERGLQRVALLVHGVQARPRAEDEAHQDHRGEPGEQRDALAHPGEAALEGERAAPQVHAARRARPATARGPDRLGVARQLRDRSRVQPRWRRAALRAGPAPGPRASPRGSPRRPETKAPPPHRKTRLGAVPPCARWAAKLTRRSRASRSAVAGRPSVPVDSVRANTGSPARGRGSRSPSRPGRRRRPVSPSASAGTYGTSAASANAPTPTRSGSCPRGRLDELDARADVLDARDRRHDGQLPVVAVALEQAPVEDRAGRCRTGPGPRARRRARRRAASGRSPGAGAGGWRRASPRWPTARRVDALPLALEARATAMRTASADPAAGGDLGGREAHERELAVGRPHDGRLHARATDVDAQPCRHAALAPRYSMSK